MKQRADKDSPAHFFKPAYLPGPHVAELRASLPRFRAQLRWQRDEKPMFGWLRPNKQQAMIREDRKYLEARARRLLKGYLSSDLPRKHRYYEAVAGAVAACEPGVSDPNLDDAQRTHSVAEAALKIVKQRQLQFIADKDQVAALITDAYATVAIANRRASAAYGRHNDLQQLGTAAVHLVTIATSFMSGKQQGAPAADVQRGRN